MDLRFKSCGRLKFGPAEKKKRVSRKKKFRTGRRWATAVLRCARWRQRPGGPSWAANGCHCWAACWIRPENGSEKKKMTNRGIDRSSSSFLYVHRLRAPARELARTSPSAGARDGWAASRRRRRALRAPPCSGRAPGWTGTTSGGEAPSSPSLATAAAR